MKTLKNVAVGQTVTVKKLTGEGPVKRRDSFWKISALWQAVRLLLYRRSMET